jgi:parallel beta-helix repeat protein
LLNSFATLDRPGEYVVHSSNGRSRLYVWPHRDDGAAPTSISISRHSFGFNVQGCSDVTFEGFTIQKFMSRVGHRGAGITNDEEAPQRIVIRNNVITACNKDPGSGWKHAAINLGAARQSLVEANHIYENRGCGGIYTFGRGVTIKKNVIRRNGYQGSWVMGARDCEVIGNEVLDNRGTHSNGISVYAGSSDIRVFGNRVFNSNIAFTSQDSANVTLAGNVFYTPGFYAVADWGKCENLRLFHNVLRRDDHGPEAVLSLGPGTSAVSRNNIFVGQGAGVSRDHNANLLVGREAMNSIFLDPAQGDYRLKAGSPAIDAGIDVGITLDPLGTAVPQGQSADIGAYEFTP